ncbi:MAG TPA: DNA polymerase/3'-5' exonuclease PolX [Syntrophorhabdales bacterium]|nr:DNA polymerase/3'-5' exonuclease PolX [Syntrophorhabdales bacterium]
MPPKSIPALLEQIGNLLDMKGENPFKVRAYHNAARALSEVEDLDAVIQAGQLREIKGIGDAIATKLEEYVKTGKMTYYEELTKEIPLSLLELLQIPNLGPRKIKVLYDTLGIANVGELEYAAKENRLASLFGFGARTQEKILEGIEFIKKHKGEFLLGDIYPLAMKIKEGFDKITSPEMVEVCGSIRRRKEIVRDIDILVAGTNPKKLSAHFLKLPEVEDVIAEGETKTSVRLNLGIEADLRVVSKEAYPYALMYFTGSKEHNVKLRGIAKKKNLKLNEYGLFTNGDSILLRTEAEIYKHLGLSYIPPELREETGEIEAAQAGKLPDLVMAEDLKGTFHVHTLLSDGVDTLDKIAEAARKMGLSYVGITDHSKTAAYAGGLKVDTLRQQWDEIDRLNAKNSDVYLFKGIESDILPDGSLDYDEKVLEELDFVVGSIHSSFTMKRADMEKRILKAMKNPFMTMLGHPTGRLLLAREGYDVDMKNIIEMASKYQVILELNASPYRLDIDWRYMKMAKQQGVMVAINPDAHSTAGLEDLFYGIGAARKGWQEKGDILNTRTVKEVKKIFERLRNEKRD